MSHADDELLAELAISGPEAADVDPAVRQHVASCETCSASVAELSRALTLTSRSRPNEPWNAPGPDVWSRITEQIDHAEGNAGRNTSAAVLESSVETRSAPGETFADPADLSRARRTRQGRPGSGRPGSGRPRLIGWTAGLAAAGLAIGLFTGRALWAEPGGTPATVSQVALDTLDDTNPQQLGEAAVVRTSSGYSLKVDTSKPLDAGDGYLEVWLINRDLKRMVSVGVLSGEGPASFPISSTLIDQGYIVVDISREQFDDNAAHSGDSIVRGKLPA